MAWAMNCSVREAAEFFIAGRLRSELLSRELDNLAPFASEHVTLVWEKYPNSPIDLPFLIIGSADILTEFVRFVAASPDAPTPISAFCRLLTHRQFQQLLPSSDKVRNPRVGEAALGLIFAEAFLESKGSTAPDGLTPTTAKRTLSFVGARQVAVGTSGDRIRFLVEKWAQVNSMVGDTISADIAYLIEPPLQLLRTIGDAPESRLPGDEILWPLAEFCHVVIEGQESEREQLWNALTMSIPRLRNANRLIKLDRERRLLLVEELLLEDNGKHSGASLLEDFLLGFLVSQVGPGTMAHLQVLGSSLRRNPAVTLWYGFFSGLQSNGRMASSRGFLGQKILREINRPINLLSPPEADIQLTELEEVFTAHGKMSFLRSGRSFVEIEIEPFSDGSFRWPEGNENVKKQAALFEERSSPAESTRSREFDEALRELRQALTTFERTLAEEDKPDPDLALKRPRRRK